jgi:hypothetical protein
MLRAVVALLVRAGNPFAEQHSHAPRRCSPPRHRLCAPPVGELFFGADVGGRRREDERHPGRRPRAGAAVAGAGGRLRGGGSGGAGARRVCGATRPRGAGPARVAPGGAAEALPLRPPAAHPLQPAAGSGEPAPSRSDLADREPATGPPDARRAPSDLIAGRAAPPAAPPRTRFSAVVPRPLWPRETLFRPFFRRHPSRREFSHTLVWAGTRRESEWQPLTPVPRRLHRALR